MSKYYTDVIVYYNDGDIAKCVDVILEFGRESMEGIAKGFTDNRGIAMIGHNSTGIASLTVEGKRIDSFKVPGRLVVYIS